MSRSSPRGHTAHTGEGETTSHSPRYSRRSQYRLEAPSDQSTHLASCSPAAILPLMPCIGMRDPVTSSRTRGMTWVQQSSTLAISASCERPPMRSHEDGLALRSWACAAKHLDGLERRLGTFGLLVLVGRLPTLHGLGRGRASAARTTAQAQTYSRAPGRGVPFNSRPAVWDVPPGVLTCGAPECGSERDRAP
jgi:hypothetical protein